MTWFVFLFALGAVARITRFITDDYLFQPTRNWLDRRQGDKTIGLGTLTNCSWCASIYVSAGVYGLAWYSGGADWWLWPAAALTASWLYATASSFTEAEE